MPEGKNSVDLDYTKQSEPRYIFSMCVLTHLLIISSTSPPPQKDSNFTKKYPKTVRGRKSDESLLPLLTCFFLSSLRENLDQTWMERDGFFIIHIHFAWIPIHTYTSVRNPFFLCFTSLLLPLYYAKKKCEAPRLAPAFFVNLLLLLGCLWVLFYFS